MGRLYVRILDLHKTSDDAKKLMGTMSAVSGSSTGRMDYAEVVYSVIKSRFTTSAEISVYDVNRYLERISSAYQNNNRQTIEVDLQELIQKMSALEQKWFVRIILKRLRLGIGEKKIFGFLNPRAPDLFIKYSDLEKVCQLIDGDRPVEEFDEKVDVFNHIRPMLCGRVEVSLLQGKCAAKNFYLETKMDGERFQLHIQDGVYRYYSRNGYDYTSTFGVDNVGGVLTPALSRLLSPKLKSVIFDGEMMVWNKEGKYYHTKGENFDVKTLQSSDPERWPCYVVFDILYYNGTGILEKPLAERMSLMRSLITDQVGVLMRCRQRNVLDHNDVMLGLNQAIDDQEEGIVIKEIDAPYQPNQRNGGWYKLKADYIDGLVDNFDLIIIGAYLNKSRKWVDKFVVGVRDTTRDEPTFMSVSSLSGGLSRREWSEIVNELKPHWVNVNLDKSSKTKSIKDPPAGLQFGPAIPDVWINPKNSIVLEIKASELTKTTSFRTNYTLRFPRVLAIRRDKSWTDCCTLTEFNALCPSTTSGHVQKIAKRFVASDLQTTAVRQPKMAKKIKSPDADLVEIVEKIDDICDGIEFCVISGSKKHKLTVTDLERLVRAHAGRIVKNPGTTTTYVIASDMTVRVRDLIKHGKYDVISSDWLVGALAGDTPKTRLLDIHPKYVISSSPKLKWELVSKFDENGDSFREPLTRAEMEVLLTEMSVADSGPFLTRAELYNVENEIVGTKSIYNFFRMCHGLFLDENDGSKLARLIFSARGGLTSVRDPTNSRNVQVTHIFVNRQTLKLDELKVRIRDMPMVDQSVNVVDYEWIIVCDKQVSLVDQSTFLVPLD